MTDEGAPLRQLAKRITGELKGALSDFDDEVTLARHLPFLVGVLDDQERCSVPVQRYAPLVARLRVVYVEVNTRFGGRKLS